MGCRNGFSAAAIPFWLEREDLEARGQDHSYRRGVQRRSQGHEPDQARWGRRSNAHRGSRLPTSSGEVKGVRFPVLPAEQPAQWKAKSGSGKVPPLFALPQRLREAPCSTPIGVAVEGGSS